jgi:Domain of unknown function (DUF4145)
LIESVAPKRDADAFHCPFCHVYSWMSWYTDITLSSPKKWPELAVAECFKCKERSIWIGERMVEPSLSLAPPPHAEMPEDIRSDYLEAASIAARSPRSAAALLRLCIQRLCAYVGQSGARLNDDIRALVKQGLISVPVQRGLDSVRVTGNNAVHPGTMDLGDNAAVASQLFKIVNYVTEHMISIPREIGEAFEALPEGAQSAISRRDGSKAQPGIATEMPQNPGPQPDDTAGAVPRG